MVLLDDQNHAMTFGITMWTKAVPRTKIVSQILLRQILSTDPNLAYFKSDGSAVNKNCMKKRTDWTSHNLHESKTVRIHVALPKPTQFFLLKKRVKAVH